MEHENLKHKKNLKTVGLIWKNLIFNYYENLKTMSPSSDNHNSFVVIRLIDVAICVFILTVYIVTVHHVLRYGCS